MRADILAGEARGFSRLQSAFAASFDRGEELGARFCAWRDGEKIVDLWGGHADRARSAPFTDQTLVAIYSCGKAVMAMLVADAVSEGALDYEAPVSAVWPEFADGGKAAVTLAQALSHQAGLCGFETPMRPQDWLDFDLIAQRLAHAEPLWPPGAASGYGPQTIGYIVGEMLRRATGERVGARLRSRHANTDVVCGLSDDDLARAAQMTKPPRAPTHRQNSRFTEIAFLKPWSSPAGVSAEAWARAEIPASNMHATAEGLARIVHPLAQGGDTAVSRRAYAQALSIRISGADLVLPIDIAWAAGLMSNAGLLFGPEPTAFGHAGFGGAAVAVDPSRRLSFAYTPTKMSPALFGDSRFLALADALYADL